VQLRAPIARQVLTEMNTGLLLDTGQLTETGLRRTADRGLIASWALSWPEQRTAGVEPIVLQAHFGGGFHHPHLRGTTVDDWPLNVFSNEDAAAQLSILRAIASSDLHNLVDGADYRIVPGGDTLGIDEQLSRLGVPAAEALLANCPNQDDYPYWAGGVLDLN
jgi:hypothetical protein